MKQEVIDNHINLYVNEFSISLGKEGRKSVLKVFESVNAKESQIFL